MAIRADDHIRAKCFHPSGRFVEFPRADLEISIPARFRRMVRLYPDRLAVKAADRSLTYRQLDDTSDAIGQAILGLNDDGERPIVLLLDQGVDAVPAMMGALKAGKCYVPLDPSFPLSTLRLVLEDCQANLVVTDPSTVEIAAQASGSGARMLRLRDLSSAVGGESLDNDPTPDTPSFIFYTSGTTGRPKGVVHTHRSSMHATLMPTNLAHFCAEDRFGAPFSHSFSVYIRYLFGALLNGGTLLPFNIKERGIPALAQWLDRESVTVCGFNGSLFRQFLNHLGEAPGNYATLRLCFVGSESLSDNDVQLYKKRLPDHTILAANMGISEAATIRNLLIDKETEIREPIVPVGFAVVDKEILLLDEAGEKVGFDAIGEIAVKSDYLTLGYWRQPDLTAAKFIADPADGTPIYLTGDLGRMSPDGCLYYIGRKDATVKIRGYKVDTPKVEMALLGHPGVKQAAVAPQEGRNGDINLAAYIVPAPEQRPSGDQLREFLKLTLPDYMIPSTYVELQALPLTPTGKIDRQSLPKPSGSRPQLDVAYVSFRNGTEQELIDIWQEVLDVRPIGVHDNFFDLGGHSLTASRIVSAVFQRFRLQIPLDELFQSATIADMAKIVAENPGKRLNNEELQSLLRELESLSDEDARKLLGESERQTSKS